MLDLKKVSKLNSFVDSNGKKYEISDDFDKAKTLLIIYIHGDILNIMDIIKV